MRPVAFAAGCGGGSFLAGNHRPIRCSGRAIAAGDSGVRVLAVDDVENLDAQAQLEFFHLYNTLRECQGAVLATGDVAPARLQLRPDLLTRLGWD